MPDVRSKRGALHMTRPERGRYYNNVLSIEAFRHLAAGAREQGKGAECLFHGTRHPNAILSSGRLACSLVIPKIAFSRSPEEAAYWATLSRDDDEGRGAVLVFDRRQLSTRYHIQCAVDPGSSADEQEELIWSRHVALRDGLITFVSEPYLARSHDERLTAREIAERMKSPKRPAVR